MTYGLATTAARIACTNSAILAAVVANPYVAHDVWIGDDRRENRRVRTGDSRGGRRQSIRHARRACPAVPGGRSKFREGRLRQQGLCLAYALRPAGTRMAAEQS